MGNRLDEKVSDAEGVRRPAWLPYQFGDEVDPSGLDSFGVRPARAGARPVLSTGHRPAAQPEARAAQVTGHPYAGKFQAAFAGFPYAEKTG